MSDTNILIHRDHASPVGISMQSLSQVLLHIPFLHFPMRATFSAPYQRRDRHLPTPREGLGGQVFHQGGRSRFLSQLPRRSATQCGSRRTRRRQALWSIMQATLD